MKTWNLVALPVLLYGASCVTPAPIEGSWENPEVKKDTTKLFSKILFAALLKDDYTRRVMEDKLVASVNGRGVASYRYLSLSDSRMDEKLLSDRLKQDGFDGVIIMRLSPDDKQQPYQPGAYPSYYSTWYGYYSSSFPRYNDPGYYSASNLYHIETSVYSLSSGKMIWTGITTIVQTKDTGKMAESTIAMVKEQMRRQGLVK